MLETTRMLPAGTRMDQTPLSSETVPVVVPLIWTAAIGTGSPSSSVTVPRTRMDPGVWAAAKTGAASARIAVIRNVKM